MLLDSEQVDTITLTFILQSDVWQAINENIASDYVPAALFLIEQKHVCRLQLIREV